MKNVVHHPHLFKKQKCNKNGNICNFFAFHFHFLIHIFFIYRIHSDQPQNITKQYGDFLLSNHIFCLFDVFLFALRSNMIIADW